MLFCDVIVDFVLPDVALQMNCCHQHTDIGDNGLKEEPDRISVPSQATLVEQVDAEREEREEDDEQE